MASTSNTSSPYSSSWTHKQNKKFEEALAIYDQNTADRWEKIAKLIGKSAKEVERHYDILVRDIMRIDSDQIPLPKYRSSGSKGIVMLILTIVLLTTLILVP